MTICFHVTSLDAQPQFIIHPDALPQLATFETMPKGYERFHCITIQADNLFTLLMHVEESRSEELQPHEEIE